MTLFGGQINAGQIGGGQRNAGQISGGQVSSSRILYDLEAPFNVANIAFSDTDVLGPTQGVLRGSLTVVKTGAGGNSVEVVDGELELVGTGTWNQTGLFATSVIVRELGRGAFFTQTHNTATNRFLVGFHSSGALTTSTSAGIQVENNGTIVYNQSGNNLIIGVYSSSTVYQSLILLGGYDTNGIPFKTGDTVADFVFGARAFIKGGAFAAWTLLWADANTNTSNQFLTLNQNDTDTSLTDNIYIPTNPLSPSIMFQPKYLSTFTGANGTQIVAYDPEVGGRLESGGTTWTIQDNKAVNDPGLEGELHTDANAASDPFGNEADDMGDWIEFGLNGTGENVFESQEAVKNVGSYALHSDADHTPAGGARFYKDIGTEFSLVVGKTYRLTFDWRHIGGGGDIWSARFASSTQLGANVSEVDTVDNPDVTFNSLSYDFTYSANYRYFGFRENSTTNNNGGVYVDNLSCKELTLNEIFATDDLGITQGIFDVPITIPTANDGFAGLVLALNSVNSPTDYIEVFYNRGTGKVEVTKFVAGSPTSLMNETTAYGGAGAQLRAILTYISATDDLKLRVYYNGALVGTEQTIEDNSIAGNTRHGPMSVSANNSIGLFSVIKVTDPNWDAEISRATGGVY